MPMHSPAHPGRIIKSALIELDLSIAKAAKLLGVSRMQLNRVVKGDSTVTAEMAVRLEATIGSTADHWLRLQSAYDLAQVRNRADNPAKGLKRIYVTTDNKPERASLT